VGSGVGGTHVGGGAVTPVGTADDAAIAGPARSINIARSMEATRSVYAALLLCTVTDGEGGVVAPEEDEEHEHEILLGVLAAVCYHNVVHVFVVWRGKPPQPTKPATCGFVLHQKRSLNLV
jgi:hypothetical protein